MHDRDAAESCAADIILSQSAAQQMPLTEVRSVLADLQHDLAKSLDAFNGIILDHAGRNEPVNLDTLKAAISEVAEQATCTAIFALGLCQRTHLAAHQN
jgi:hypothetical protein